MKRIGEQSEMVKSRQRELDVGHGGRGQDEIGSSRLKQWIEGNRFCGGVLSARPYAAYRAHADGLTAEKEG